MGDQAARRPEQGCFITITASSAGDPNANNPIQLYYHLGVLLATNGAAHMVFPALPVASANELALAEQVPANPQLP
jgi:hypothetical protein